MILTIGERLKEIRTFRKLDGKELAEASGVPATTITAIEKGRIPNPGGQNLGRLADALEVRTDYILDDRGVPTWDALGIESLEVFLRGAEAPEELQSRMRGLAKLPSCPTSVKGWRDLIENLRYFGLELVQT